MSRLSPDGLERSTGRDGSSVLGTSDPRSLPSVVGQLSRVHGLTALVFIASCFVLAQYGWLGLLPRDDAVFIYSGQQLLRGVPPYLSVFDAKGPWAFVVTAPALFLADVFGWDEMLSVRISFLLISAAAVVGVFLLGKILTSPTAGVFAALVFTAFEGFGIKAISGSNAKTFVLALHIFAVVGIVSKRWFWAGLLSSMAVLTWQPMAYLVVVAAGLCIVSSNAGERRTNFARFAGGAGIPVVPIVLYYLIEDALQPLLQGMFELPLQYLDRSTIPLAERLGNIRRVLANGYPTTQFVIVSGWLLLPPMFVSRIRAKRGWRAFFRDPSAGFFLTALFALAWAILDFQGPPDGYPLLPYAAVSVGWGLHAIVNGLWRGRAAFQVVTASLLATALFVFGVYQYGTRFDHRLDDQRRAAQLIDRRWVDRGRVATLGSPAAMVLLGATNPNPYVATYRQTRKWIDDREPGGIKGWLDSISRYRPEVVVVPGVGWTTRHWLVRRWLQRNYEVALSGQWDVYIPK